MAIVGLSQLRQPRPLLPGQNVATAEEEGINAGLARPAGATLRTASPSVVAPPAPTGPSTITPPASGGWAALPPPGNTSFGLTPAPTGTPISSITPPAPRTLPTAKTGQANVVQGAQATGQLPTMGGVLGNLGLPGGVMLPPPMPRTPPGPLPPPQPRLPDDIIVPPPGQPPEPPDTGGGAVTPFGPENDLRFSQFNPLASERLGTTQGFVNTAARGVAEAPDLRTAAAENLRLLEEQSQPGYEASLRDVGRRASALGRLGAGMTTSELGDVTTRREQGLSQARRGLAANLTQAEAAERRARLGSLAGLEGGQFGQEAAQRGELRGERDYQAGTAREATDRRIQERLLEDYLTGSQFGRETSAADLGLRGAALDQLGQESAYGTASDLLGGLGLEQSLSTPGGVATSAVAPGGTPDQDAADFADYAGYSPFDMSLMSPEEQRRLRGVQ